MNRFIDPTILQSNWFFYGAFLIIAIPLIIVFLNEILYRKRKQSNTLIGPIRLLRNFILPLIAVVIVCTKIMGYNSDLTFIKVLHTIIYILLINGLLAIINSVFFSSTSKSNLKTKIPQLFLDIFRVLLVFIGAAIVLSAVWGADLTGMITALGLGSFVIGLALQDTLGNLFSGIALIYERPFSVGDTIKVNGIAGEVLEMNWRAVRLLTRKNEMIIIPHLIIGQTTVENLSKPTEVYINSVIVGYSYDIPPNKVKDVICQAIIEVPNILDEPIAQVRTHEFGDNSISYNIEYPIQKFNDAGKINNELLTRIWYVSNRENLDMPYPHLNLIFDKDKDQPNSKEQDEAFNNKINRIADLLPIPSAIIPKIKNNILSLPFGKEERIIKRGTSTGTLYLIVSGTVKLVSIGDNGEEQIIRTIGKDDFFGEISTLSNKKINYDVIAQTDLDVLCINEDAVRYVIDLYPKVVYYLGETKSEKSLIGKFKFIEANKN